MTVLPTGQQYLLSCAGAEVTVVEVGGGLRTYRTGGREVVDGFAEHELAEYGRGNVLAPWPNRLRDGRYTWDGEEQQLPINEPEVANAIHGLVRFVSWSVVERASDAITLEHLLHPQPGYPFALRLRVGYELSPEGLTVTTSATNEGGTALPYGEGHHPYLAAGAGLRVDDCTVVAPGATRLETDERGIPTGSAPVEGTEYDLRAGRLIGELRIDHAFTDLERGPDGLAEVRLTGPDGRGAAVWMDGSYDHVQVFTGDVVVGPRRRGGLAVEPMTCPPNALQTGDGVRRLEPGETVTGRWGIRPIG